MTDLLIALVAFCYLINRADAWAKQRDDGLAAFARVAAFIATLGAAWAIIELVRDIIQGTA